MSLYSPQGFIFIHNRKTGGTTMRNLLLGPMVRYLTIPHETAVGVREHFYTLNALGHWNLAFKFAFVRDPYTWVESMRRHCIKQEDHPLRDMALGEVEQWPERLAQACRNGVATTDGNMRFQRHMVLGYSGEPILDRLCRFENYADEVSWVLAHLGIVQPEILPREGLHDVPQVEIGGAYREAIAEHFEEDFKALGYDVA